MSAVVAPAALAWKPDWPATRERFLRWWERKGPLVGAWLPPESGDPPREDAPFPPPAASPRAWHVEAAPRAQREHAMLARRHYNLDCLPVAVTAFGPGSLATMLGSEPGFSPETVWYEPCWKDVADPETLPALRFDPANPWWRAHEAVMRACAERAQGRYLVGIPDLVEGIDILASLRDAQTLLVDMAERPEWVDQKLAEIDDAWFAVYERCYELCRQDDGGVCFWAFVVWGPGRTAKLQCDASAMFSPRMFRRFVVPSLTRQCAWLDRSLYHLDGSQCLCHLDALLAIDDLDAIEWTPDPKVPAGGDPHWYPLYRRIKAAGKCVQAVGVRAEQIAPLLDAVGPEGVYVLADFRDRREMDAVERVMERYR